MIQHSDPVEGAPLCGCKRPAVYYVCGSYRPVCGFCAELTDDTKVRFSDFRVDVMRDARMIEGALPGTVAKAEAVLKEVGA